MKIKKEAAWRKRTKTVEVEDGKPENKNKTPERLLAGTLDMFALRAARAAAATISGSAASLGGASDAAWSASAARTR